MIFRHDIYNRFGYGTILVVSVLVPAVLLVSFLIVAHVRTSRMPETKPVAIAERSGPDNASVDSDRDGLKDWEEAIYGTDPHNPDTDGDGTNDGDEIAQGRDPLKKGPNDFLTHTSIPADTPAPLIPHAEDHPNLTKKLAEMFGTDYLTNLVQNPQDRPDVSAIADKMTQLTLDQPTPQTPRITAKDLIVSHHTAKEDVMRYVKEFNAAILNPLNPLPDTKSISGAMTDIVHTDDTARASTAANKLATYVNAYNQFLARIKTISVPENFVPLHVDYVNITIKEREALKKIQDIKNDPVMTLMGFREFIDTTASFDKLQQRYTELLLGTSTQITRQ